ncbi:uncharacterized protein LOC115224049 [Octopus sinensis]|uniref:Uncharacterized protein LOC115224049 n=1 Tax=Octopus sinensis TaxID=2607531 RepID=A0A6P7TH73_9MOLL|nr:uncharacterized protein LOC115224049 [Octopus sinensis]XP_036368903.1 uncharacterized protein LOC115224049 [Octopus sinensis]
MIYEKARLSGIDINAVPCLVRSHLQLAEERKLTMVPWQRKKTLHHIIIIAFTLCLLLSPTFQDWLQNSPCLLENNEILMEVLRPASNCEELCLGMDSVPTEFNISTEKFMQKYAYTGHPVLIKNATTNWTALKMFNFNFFHKLFSSRLSHLEECMFFPYNTNFTSFAQFLGMPLVRARFDPGQLPWYVGWSNCDPEISVELRKHYEKPYFLPRDSEATSVDWIFMGGFGKGAHIHIDAVKRPSWQAMIAGKKTFMLIVPPECEHLCKYTLNATMETGDILILDTNQWYHSTYIHPEEVSVAIGSEYD